MVCFVLATLQEVENLMYNKQNTRYFRLQKQIVTSSNLLFQMYKSTVIYILQQHRMTAELELLKLAGSMYTDFRLYKT